MENLDNKQKKEKMFYWSLIASNLIVVTSTFFTWAADSTHLGIISNQGMTLLEWLGIGGWILISLASLNILFAFFCLKIPIYVVSLLILAFVGIVISIGCPYSYGIYGIGFYILILGIILMVVSFPILHIALKRNRKK